MKNKKALIVLIILSIFISANAQTSLKKGGMSKADQTKMEKFIDNLLSKMTLEEKVGQMHQIGGDYAVTGPLNPNSKTGEDLRAGRLGSMLNVVGVENVRKFQKVAVEETRLKIPMIFGHDIIHGCKTIFPIPLGESASWDLKVIERSARIAASEASAMGLNWTFAPMVDIARDARWGRIAEGAGEDPYLGSLIAKARVSGFQGNDLSAKTSLVACAKHFAAYGAAEGGRDYNLVDMSENTLREVYLRPFHAAVEEGVGTLMNSFNSLNGVPSTANEFLNRKVLKGEWNFKGFVISDAGSVSELIPHGFAADRKEAAELGAKAQCDIDMNTNIYRDELPALVKSGKVPMKVIDESVKRVLRIKYMAGLFENPYKNCDPKREKIELMKPEYIAAARDAAKKSIVLLKNENCLLPLSKEVKSIAVIGPLADSKNDMIGCWGGAGDAKDCVTILEGIKSAVSKDTKVEYIKGCEMNSDKEEDFSAAIKTAENSDVIIAAVGEAGDMTGEAHCRTDIGLPGNQLDLLKALKKTGKPVVVLLGNGRPLAIKWLADNIPSIVETWFLGTQAGHAVADVVFGDYNPSGKLTVSFPYNVGQEPLYYAQKSTGRPAQKNPDDWWRTHYLDAPNDALYPFGFGLSYTTYEYSNLILDNTAMKKDGNIEVSVDVKNTGTRDGEEVVQLYLNDVVAAVVRPMKELIGFTKILIKAGETKTVKFNITIEDLKYFNKDNQWTADAGDFRIFAGSSSEKLLKQSFRLQ